MCSRFSLGILGGTIVESKNGPTSDALVKYVARVYIHEVASESRTTSSRVKPDTAGKSKATYQQRGFCSTTIWIADAYKTFESLGRKTQREI